MYIYACVCVMYTTLIWSAKNVYTYIRENVVNICSGVFRSLTRLTVHMW